MQLISVIELSTGGIDFKFQFFFHFSPFHSVSLPLSMSYLEILRNVSIDIRQRRSFYTRWHRSALIRTIKSYWVDVSWIPDFFNDFERLVTRWHDLTIRCRTSYIECWTKSFPFNTIFSLYPLSIVSDKDAVEKRLYILQKQGFIYSTNESEE